VIALSGDLDAAGKETIRAQLARVDEQGSTVVDLSRVTYIDSTFLSELLMFARNVHQRGGRVFLCAPSASVLRVLHIAKIEDVIPIFADRESAMRQASELG